MPERCFDPRDTSQSANQSETWRETSNPALILAMLQQTQMQITPDWGLVAAAANVCDEPVDSLLKIPTRGGRSVPSDET